MHRFIDQQMRQKVKKQAADVWKPVVNVYVCCVRCVYVECVVSCVNTKGRENTDEPECKKTGSRGGGNLLIMRVCVVCVVCGLYADKQVSQKVQKVGNSSGKAQAGKQLHILL